MTEKEEEQFQSNNTCWICEKTIENDNEKVRDNCHVTGKLEEQLIGVVTSCDIS